MNCVIKISYILTSSLLLSNFSNFKAHFQISLADTCESEASLWCKREESPPVFSSGFALSCSEVFTISVRLLSVNTSINTAQRFTSYASFRLSHLLNRRNRTESEWNNLSPTTTSTSPSADTQCSNERNDFKFDLKKAPQRLSGHKRSLFILHSDSWLRLI